MCCTLISANVNRKAIISKGAHISGNGYNLIVGFGASIGINCSVGSDLIIGSGTMMGPDCLILTQNHKFDYNKGKLIGFETKNVIIGKKCWIGARCIILPGAKIGNGCIIGSGAVVPNKEYPDNSLIAGNPAKVLKKLI